MNATGNLAYDRDTSKMKPLRLSIVVPCYNEEAVLPETVSRLAVLLKELIDRDVLDSLSKMVLVDDGSRDQTWNLIRDFAANGMPVVGVKLSRNCGHQSALLAGIFSAAGDAVVTVDADLQDDLDAIEQMVAAHNAGAEVVYGVRRRRDTDTWFKRTSAEGFYRLMAFVGVETVFNHADYRLLGRRAVNALKEFEESNLFLRGIIPQLGFQSCVVYYDRAERFAGESKYPFRKMMAFAWEGVTSFSAAPLRAITGVGLLIALGSFAVTGWALWTWASGSGVVPGWASTVVPMYFLGGIQLLCIGILGEYLAKVYLETKRRPRYFVEQIISEESTPSRAGQGTAECRTDTP